MTGLSLLAIVPSTTALYALMAMAAISAVVVAIALAASLGLR